jgi:hypothetical protein
MFKPVIAIRITKAQWYAYGGFENPKCWRRRNKTHWEYYINQ